MKNFKEQNFSVQPFTVINPDETKEIKNKSISDKIDAQFLPESGHLLANTRNVIGLIIKDENSFGIPDVFGDLLDSKNEVLASFTVNNLGIGRFSFVPENDEKYTVRIVYNNKESFFSINNIEQKGVVLSTIQKENEVILSIKTNKLTLPSIKNKMYKVTLHNGKKLTNYPVKFNRKNTIYHIFETDLLSPGVNVFTLFDELNNPIAERLAFNFRGVKTATSDAFNVKKSTDSLAISLSYKTINIAKLNNISVSVLPTDTIAYKHHHNIVSYNYLQPYLKGEIENAQYYFNIINNTTKFHLDNLLITQGWSSYSWYNIFNQSSKINYFF
ncbi:MAG: hypothetical protein V3V28_00180 [Polaribacter sp.]|uniref:hypothetical protein n=1 Tax=Polaribacter sp. TaxID=1920175 RepID=UPI002F357494